MRASSEREVEILTELSLYCMVWYDTYQHVCCVEIKMQHPQWDLSCVYSQMQKWRETPKRLRHGGKKVEIGQTHIFPELQIGQKA